MPHSYDSDALVIGSGPGGEGAAMGLVKMCIRDRDDEWRQQAEALRDALRAQNLNVHLIGRATKTKIALDQDCLLYTSRCV